MLLRLCCAVGILTAAASALSLGAVPEVASQALSQHALEAVRDAVLLATKDDDDLQVDISTRLQPVLVLVEEMLRQLTNHSLDDIEMEREVQRREQEKLHLAKSELAALTHDRDGKSVVLDVLSEERDAAKAAVDTLEQRATALQDTYDDHQNNCLNDLPTLHAQRDRVEADMHLLNSLRERVTEIHDTHGDSDKIAEVMMQLQTSVLSHHPEVQTLLELGEGADEDEHVVNSEALQRMLSLLDKLIGELGMARDNAHSSITGLHGHCEGLDTELSANITQTKEELTQQKAIVADRQAQIEQLTPGKDEADRLVGRAQAEVDRQEKDIRDRMHIYLTLMKATQHTMLILSQIRQIMVQYTSQLNTLSLPTLNETASAKNAFAQVNALISTALPPKPKPEVEKLVAKLDKEAVEPGVRPTGLEKLVEEMRMEGERRQADEEDSD